MEIKVGDKVRVSKDAPKIYSPKEEDGIVMDIDGEDALIKSECTGVPNRSPWWALAIPTKYLIRVDAEAKATEELQEEYARFMSVNPKPRTIPKIMFNTEFWVKYEADLAKEIAVKVANKYSDPTEAAEYAVRVAKAVVKNLKQK